MIRMAADQPSMIRAKENKWVRFLLVALYSLSLIIFGVMARLPLGGALTTMATLVAMASAGIVLLRHLVSSIDSPICLLVFGSILGSVIGRLLLIISALCLSSPSWAAALTLGVLTFSALLLAISRPRSLPRWGPEDRQELNWIFGLNSAVLLAMSFPFWGVGHITSKGYAFVPYFHWDFFNHVACTAELARSVPPENPYFAGHPFHYYWFSYLWPAAVVNLSDVTARDALVLTIPAAVFLFIASLTCLVRLYMPRSSPRHLAIGLGLFAFSYIGVFYILSKYLIAVIHTISHHVDLTYSTFLSHSWFRDFLYEPHSLTALTLLVFLLYLSNAIDTRSGVGSGIVTGLMLGAITTADLFIGLIALLWFASMNLRPVLLGTADQAHIVCTTLVTVAVILGAFGLQLFPTQHGGTYTLGFAVHRMAKFAPIYLIVELGPLVIFGSVGLYFSVRGQGTPFTRSMLLLLAIALFLAFSVGISHEPDLVIRKGIKAVQIPLVVFASVACSGYLGLPYRHWLRIVCLPLILAGFLTLCTDILQYIDLEAERVPHVMYISPNKMRALEWIRTRTARDAIVQLFDEVRPERGLNAYEIDISIPSLGERRTLFGNNKKPYENHIPNSEIEKRKAVLTKIFAATDMSVMKFNLDLLPEHYVLVDTTSPGPIDCLFQLRDAGYLEEVFRAGEVSVLMKGGAPVSRKGAPTGAVGMIGGD